MTVGLIGHYLGARMGIGVYLDRLLEPLMDELADRDITAKIISSPNALKHTPAIERLSQQPSHSFGQWPSQPVTVLPALDYAPIKRFSWMATQFSDYCQQQGFDQIVWLSNPIVMPWHPPSIAVLHDVNEWKEPEKYGSRLKTTLRSWMYLEASLQWAQKIVCVSEATTADLCHFRPSDRICRKVRTIPNGLDSPLRSLAPAEIEVPSAPFLLSVGRIDPAGKKLPEAVALVEALRSVSGEPWELHLTGGMNASTQQAGEDFIQSVATIPWVRYHGYINDPILAAWYSHATAVVFLSDNEGFGSPVAEAASFGKRVIVSTNNEATLGAGGNAVIPVASQDAKQAAIAVLNQVGNASLSATRLPAELYTYADAAVPYADEIDRLIRV
ncbi:MAG: glycosyltransferase [Phormidesmis sp.]